MLLRISCIYQLERRTRKSPVFYGYRMHEICCHEYIISFYKCCHIHSPTILQKSVKSIQSITKREDQALEMASTPSFEDKKNNGKGDILGPKYGQDYFINVLFTSGKTH